jgi:transcriptional regulator with XRE-family HTH domain|tara:strand:+ start:689 stop:1279 length:591 start_codon:yes stop_codon:yes gene_type:complete
MDWRDVPQVRREFGVLIRARRKEAGMSQTQVGDKLGMVQPIVSRIELGKVRLEPHLVERLDDALGGGLKAELHKISVNYVLEYDAYDRHDEELYGEEMWKRGHAAGLAAGRELGYDDGYRAGFERGQERAWTEARNVAVHDGTSALLRRVMGQQGLFDTMVETPPDEVPPPPEVKERAARLVRKPEKKKKKEPDDG